ncbi:hypothetical protein HK100_011964 [Physocladia obscura]|uniref:Uncharacterized protein n=1 Tax=Physocladia obscura TaxID=109957 RepID=A0AAD5T261_9FUNG|nr:hypothetical protein HK100_011964 [Physocladia obscura]
MKRNNPIAGQKVVRLNGGGGGAGGGAAAAVEGRNGAIVNANTGSDLFGVVGKVAPSNNSTKFPVLSFAPPQAIGNALINITNNTQHNNLPPLNHSHDNEGKSKYKFAQSQLQKDSVMLPSLTDKAALKLNIVPAIIEPNPTNLPSLKRK